MGKEFNTEQMDGLFAGTPPLEALRYIVHEAATIRQGEDMRTKVVMVNDVSRAFFGAPAIRNVCVWRSRLRIEMRGIGSTIGSVIYG